MRRRFSPAVYHAVLIIEQGFLKKNKLKNKVKDDRERHASKGLE